MWTRYVLFLTQAVVLASPGNAAGADRVQECIAHHLEGQLLRERGRLTAARAEFIACSEQTCPRLVRDECVTLEREVQLALPSVVLSALDENGQPTARPQVSIDGSPVLFPLDGRSIPLDVGEHQLHFQHPSGAIRELRVTLVEGERDRPVQADFRPSIDPSGPEVEPAIEEPLEPLMRDRSDSSNATLLVSGGLAVLALGGFTYFAVSGRALENDLKRCSPNCEDREDLDRMRTRYLFADVSLGVALLATGVGAVAWLTSSSDSAQARVGDETRLSLRLQPVATNRHLGLWATGEF